MKKKILASLLAGIVLATSILPTASFAQEDLGMERAQAQETSQEDKGPVLGELNQLQFFVEGKEILPTPLFQAQVRNYKIELPRETKKVTIKANPKDFKEKVWILDKEKNWKEIKDTYMIEFPSNQNYNEGFYEVPTIYISPTAPRDLSSPQEPHYIFVFHVLGYPEPVFTNFKEHYVFQKNQIVTKEDFLKTITVWDEVDGYISDKDKIEISGGNWENGYLKTKQLTKVPKTIIFRAKNSHDRIGMVSSEYSVVDELNPGIDKNPPSIEVPEKVVTCYEGDNFNKKDLLKGVKALDHEGKDLTDQVEVEPSSLEITKIVNFLKEYEDYTVTYKVKDKDGNETKESVIYRGYKKEIDPGQEEKRNKNIHEILETIVQDFYVLSGGEDGDWEATSLGVYGQAKLIDYVDLLSRAKKIVEKKPQKVTEYERITIALTAAGFDVRDLPTNDGKRINLIETISNHRPMGSNNDYIFALLAYDSGNYPVPEGATWTRKALIDYLLKVQLSQGGWSLEGSGGELEPDITAMAIQALAPYKEQEPVRKALNKALDVLPGYRSADFGYFNVKGEETSETTSQILLALVTMGINPKDDYRYSYRGGKDIVDGLLSFSTISKRFTHTKQPVEGYTVGDNPKATWQAFQALAAYQNFKEKGGKAPYYPFRFKDFSQEKPGENPSKPDKPIDPDTVVTLRDLGILSLPYKTTYEEGEEPSLDGLKVQASYSDGTSEILNNRDLNVFDFSTSSWSPNRIVTIAYGGLKTTFSIQVREKEGAHKDQANILVKDPKGRTYFPAQNLSIRPGEDTAFSLLQKTGLTYKYNYHKTYSGVYVSSIEGLAEFDGGPNSGWMYRVNGEFPNHSASLHKIYAGDKVEWLYTRDLGKDLGAKFDEEEEGYQVTINHNQGGQVSPSGQVKVKKGENLHLTIKADSGYAIDKVLVDGQDQGKVTSYQFSNLDRNHRVEVRFVQVKDFDTKDIINQGNKTLRDIPGHWAQGAMTYCLDKGYFAGKGDGTFGANDPVSRGDLVTVLGRRRKAPVKAEKSFKDVNPNTYYGPYVAWSKKQGLAHGYGGNFRPKDSMTREEMAKVFQDYLKAEKKLSKREKRTFKDQKKISSWAKESVDTLTSQGILVGDQKGNFNPKQTLTRAQVAQVLYQIDQQ